MLSMIQTSGLLYELDMIWVINHGMALSNDIINLFPTIRFIQFSNDISRFEIPTLQIMQYFSKLIFKIRKTNPIDILYLHTKGITYTPQIQEGKLKF
jgi:hypothetical protein